MDCHASLGTDHLISRGGGWDFSSRQVIFFTPFAQQVIFFKSILQQVFFLKDNTLKSEKCKRKQHIE